MKPFLLFAIASFVCCGDFCYAQNYKPGSITFVTGERDSGLIKLGKGEETPARIKFKNANKGETTYTVRDIRFFETGGMRYQREIVSIDTRPVDVLDLPDDNLYPSLEDSSRTDTVFLKIIVSGHPVNLYQYKDFRSHYYISLDSGNLQELRYSTKDDKYKQQLRNISSINWTNDLLRQVNRISYSEDELRAFVLKANTSTHYDVDLYYKKGKKMILHAGGGVAYNTLKFTGNHTRNYQHLDFNSSVSPVVSAGIDVPLGKNDPRYAFRLEISYSSFKTEGLYEQPSGVNSLRQDFIYSLHQVNIIPCMGMTYNFLHTEKLKIYGAGMFSLNISTYKENTYKKHDILSGITYADQPLGFEKSWASVSVQLGCIVTNKIEIRLSSAVIGSYLHHPGVAEKGMKSAFRLLYRFQ